MTHEPAGSTFGLAADRATILAETDVLRSQDPVLREPATGYDLNGLIIAIDDTLAHQQAVSAGPDDLLRVEAMALADASATYTAASLDALYLSEAIWALATRTREQVDTERASRLAFATAWILRISGLRKLEEADRLRFRDGLTTLLNRPAFDRDLAAALVKASEDEPVAVVVMDLDGLKAVNDRFGHLAGDRLLREFASFLGEVQGFDGSSYRWAGDEFALLFRRTSERKAMESMETATEVSAVRFSWGVSIAASPEASAQALVETADGQMYEMKAGRRGIGHRLRACWRALTGPGRPG
jgi:diguanylate cyclase (GGDEF)-like protein